MGVNLKMFEIVECIMLIINMIWGYSEMMVMKNTMPMS